VTVFDGCDDPLVVTRPHVIAQIHDSFLAAGSASGACARNRPSPGAPRTGVLGCDLYCPADDDLRRGNGTIRTLHPCELFGGDWWNGGRDQDRNHDRDRQVLISS